MKIVKDKIATTVNDVYFSAVMRYFFNALQRFISKRGKTNTIVSHFKGPVKELKLEHSSLTQTKITEFTERQHIVQKFHPPSSPHMSCSQERLVHVVKTSLFNIVKDRILTDFQMIAILTEWRTINSQPITANSDSADDLEALTLNHFLIWSKANDRNYLW